MSESSRVTLSCLLDWRVGQVVVRDPALSEAVWESLEWVTPREAAAWLRVSPKLIYRLAESDRTFPAVKVGGATRINRHRLERWLERQHRTRKPLRASQDAVEKTGETADAAKARR